MGGATSALPAGSKRALASCAVVGGNPETQGANQSAVAAKRPTWDLRGGIGVDERPLCRGPTQRDFPGPIGEGTAAARALHPYRMIEEGEPHLVTRIGMLLCWLLLLAPAGTRADAGPSPSCPAAVQLEGDPALTAALTPVLRSRGIVTQPPLGCPLSFIRVTRSPTGLLVCIHQELAQSERVVSDPAVAATLIESWMRSDLTDPLLAAPDLMTAPPPPPPPPVSPRAAPPRFTLDLLVESAIDKDGAIWVGGSLHGCAPVGPLCLGAIVRAAAEVPASYVGTYRDQRVALDVLASVLWPLRRGRWVVAPGLGLGAGWLHHQVTPSSELAAEAEDDPALPSPTPIAQSDGGIRAELRLLVRLRLKAGWQITSGLAFGTAFLDGPATQLPGGERLLLAPWAMLRGSLGLVWSGP